MSGYSFGLVGYPVSHSLSPRLQNAALKALGLEGEYRLYPVAPLPDGAAALADLLAHIRSGAIHGLNVTIPYKQAVIPYLDELTPAAQAIGAVNTILLAGEKLVGENTDAAGFWADLERVAYPVLHGDLPAGRRQFRVQPADGEAAHRHALVLGAGGSARAVVYALLQAGWQVSLAARRLEQAQSLAGSFSISDIEAQSGAATQVASMLLDRTTIAGLKPKIIVNTTPVGMYPAVDASPWPSGAPLPRQAFLYDLVYNPAETLLIRSARQAGLQAEGGLGMLIEQAALTLEHWTGQSVARRFMWQAAADFSGPVTHIHYYSW